MPESPTKKVLFHLTDEQYARLDKLATDMGVTRAEALQRAITLYQREQEEPGALMREMRAALEEYHGTDIRDAKHLHQLPGTRCGVCDLLASVRGEG